ncbi:putative transcription factor [Trifolium repens]|nr:putative transcription factor [Trifolium repens]
MAPKKSISQWNQRRVFTEEVELIILKAIPKFMSETGKNPSSTDFHTFVENLNLIPPNITVEQLKRKIRGFKTKNSIRIYSRLLMSCL